MANRETYEHKFEDGPGGWLGWMGGGGGPRKLAIRDGAARVDSPWGVDFNHAPPGAGYLHLLFCMLTARTGWEDFSGPNRFVREGFSRDFTNANVSMRIRGELDAKSAQCLWLIQSDTGETVTNFVLTGQPIPVRPQWADVTLHLTPDESQWLCLGTRGEGADNDRYGCGPIGPSLADVNVDVIVVLFPLKIVPAGPIDGDPHALRAGRDYPLDKSKLPAGHVEIERIVIEYAR